MVRRRLIGYATTDSNGVASVTYTGKGVGEMDIVAESGGEMLFHHSGTDTNETNPFYYNSSNIQVSTDTTGTLLENSASTTYNYYANLGSTGDLYDFQAPYTIEFDVVSYSATYCGIQNTETGQTGALRNFSQLTNKTSFHIKIIVTGEKIIYQIDDDTPIEQTYSTSKVRVSLTLNNGTLRYKNFFIYRGSSSLVSEPKTVLDCLFVGEKKTTGWLDGTSTTVTNVTLENGVTKWTVPSSSQYLGYRNNSASGLVGQTIKTTVNLTSTRNVRLSAFAYINGAWSSGLSSVLINSNTETDTDLTFTVPSDTTQIWVRLQSNSSSDQLAQNDVVYVNKFEIYPI